QSNSNNDKPNRNITVICRKDKQPGPHGSSGLFAGGIVVVVSLSRRQVASDVPSSLRSNNHEKSNRNPALSTKLTAEPTGRQVSVKGSLQQDMPRGVKQLETSPDPFYME
ncbi:MAG: hypothetical protein AB2556_19550, partial [Candidatus Thiodiazotropha sp.]